MNLYLAPMRILSWNVNGIRAVAKKGFYETLIDLQADILCLQETKAQDEQVKEVLFGLDYHILVNSAERKGYSGTAILSKQEPLSVNYGLGIPEHDQEGRLITAEYSTFYLINVYVPNSGNGLARLDYRKTWDQDLLNYIKSLEEKKPVILCGDLNVAHQEIDIARPKANYNKTSGYTQTEIDGLSNIMEDRMIDSFRSLHPTEVGYSWWSYRAGAREKNIGWRLDYFIMSKTLQNQLEHAFILPDVQGSDHCPVGIALKE